MPTSRVEALPMARKERADTLLKQPTCELSPYIMWSWGIINWEVDLVHIPTWLIEASTVEGEAGDGNARSLISPILINQIKLNQNVFIRPHFIPRGNTMHFTEGNGGDSDVRLNGTQSSWLHWVLPVHHRCARTTDVHRRLTQKSWSWDGCCQYTLCPLHSQFQSLTRTQNKTRYYKRLFIPGTHLLWQTTRNMSGVACGESHRPSWGHTF